MSIEALKQVDGLDVVTGIQNCMDDEDLFLSILGMYVEQLKEDSVKLAEAFAEENWILYGRICHGIKGASASVGAIDIQQQSQQLELAGKNEDNTEITAKHSNYLTKINDAIANMSAE